MVRVSSGGLFLLVSGLVAIIDLLFVYMNHHFSEQSFRQTMTHESQGLYQNFQTLMSQTYSNMLSIATFIASDPEIQQTFLSGKQAVLREGGGKGGTEAAYYRQQLFDQVSSGWSEVQKQFNARQLHFHLGPGSTSFLRVHKPEKFGDVMDDVRFTVVDTNREKKPRTGFETGRVYSGLRGVVPVEAIDQETGTESHIGALEVGTSFDVILHILADTSHYQAGVMLSQTHLKTAMWPEAYTSRFGQQDLACQCVIEAASDPQFADIIAAGRERGIVFREGGHSVVPLGDQHYLLSYFPIRDYLGTRDSTRPDAGAVIFWKDISADIALLRSAQWYNIAYGIFGFIAIELLFLLAFRLGNRQLHQTIREYSGQLLINKERLDTAQEIAQVGSWEWDIASGKLWWSDQVYRIFELDPHKTEPTYDLFLDRVHPKDRSRVEDAVQSALEGMGNYELEHRIKLPTGKTLSVLECGSVTVDATGKPYLMKGTIQDISALTKAKKRLADIIWAADVGTWELDIITGEMTCNERWASMLGYSLDDLKPLNLKRWISLIHPESLTEFQLRMNTKITGGSAIFEDEFRGLHKNGNAIWILAKGRITERDIAGKPLRLAGTCMDISVRKKSELKAKVLATTDALTGLYNRTVFNERLQEMVSLAKRTHQKFALMMLDLDGFKAVNDHYGHTTGDGLLIQIANDLQATCRDTDLVARLGGDEFAIILPSTVTVEGCEALAQRLLSLISQTRIVEGHSIGVFASIGFCLYENNEMDIKALIQAADSAMYAAKASGKNTSRAWEASLTE